MGIFSTLAVAVALFTNVIFGPSLAFSSMWMSQQTGTSTEHCVLHCLSAAVDTVRLQLVHVNFEFVPMLLVALMVASVGFFTKRHADALTRLIRPDPRLCQLLVQRE